jgi:hypothetical protein
LTARRAFHVRQAARRATARSGARGHVAFAAHDDIVGGATSHHSSSSSSKQGKKKKSSSSHHHHHMRALLLCSGSMTPRLNKTILNVGSIWQKIETLSPFSGTESDGLAVCVCRDQTPSIILIETIFQFKKHG